MTSTDSNLAWTIPASASSPAHIEQLELPIPAAGSHQVLIRLTAVSLNYRDLLVAIRSPEYPGIDGLPGNHKSSLIPCSDGAGIIHSTGPSSKWTGHEGTKVLLHPNEWLSGDVRNLNLQKVYGAAASDGM
jgi:NADPH:quinone reductase-like Zn-dependent oxidoreductase